jgi:HSP20 family protein
MLTRWDPFREMYTLRKTVDRLFETSLSDLESTSEPMACGLPLDVVENDDSFVVRASVPGIDPDDIEITFTDNVLTINGTTQVEEETEKPRYHMRERRYGSFSRSITLGTRVEGDDIEARYNNGVLELTLPKAEEVKAKRIEIKHPRMIDAKAKRSK